MTCVLAIPGTNAGDILMMADSGAGTVRESYLCPTPKIFRSGSYLIGFSGSYRLGQAVRSVALPEPDPEAGISLIDHIAGDVMNALAAGVDRHLGTLGKVFTTTPNAEGYKLGGNLIVVSSGCIFNVMPDLGVAEADPVGAVIGGAYKFAYGALFAGSESGLRGEALGDLALRTAARFSFIREPFLSLTSSSSQVPCEVAHG